MSKSVFFRRWQNDRINVEKPAFFPSEALISDLRSLIIWCQCGERLTVNLECLACDKGYRKGEAGLEKIRKEKADGE